MPPPPDEASHIPPEPRDQVEITEQARELPASVRPPDMSICARIRIAFLRPPMAMTRWRR